MGGQSGSCPWAPLPPTLPSPLRFPSGILGRTCWRRRGGSKTGKKLPGEAAKHPLRRAYKSGVGLTPASETHRVSGPTAVADGCLASCRGPFRCWVSDSLVACEEARWHFKIFFCSALGIGSTLSYLLYRFYWFLLCHSKCEWHCLSHPCSAENPCKAILDMLICKGWN